LIYKNISGSIEKINRGMGWAKQPISGCFEPAAGSHASVSLPGNHFHIRESDTISP